MRAGLTLDAELLCQAPRSVVDTDRALDEKHADRASGPRQDRQGGTNS